RDIFQRRLPLSSLRDRSIGLTLEVEDDKILFRAKDLTEVIVAMDPDAHSRAVEAAQLVEAREQGIPLGQDRVRVRTRRFVERAETLFEQVERRPCVRPHVAGE